MSDDLLLALGRVIVADDAALPARIRAVVAAMPAHKQSEFRQALTLFSSRIGGVVSLTSLQPFVSASRQAQEARLRVFRRSRLTLFRTVYLAVQRVVMSAYYADPEVQASLGYRPPAVQP
jgi:hypothetical protein